LGKKGLVRVGKGTNRKGKVAKKKGRMPPLGKGTTNVTLPKGSQAIKGGILYQHLEIQERHVFQEKKKKSKTFPRKRKKGPRKDFGHVRGGTKRKQSPPLRGKKNRDIHLKKREIVTRIPRTKRR